MQNIIPTPDEDAQLRRFHDSDINVYPGSMKLEDIKFWPENDRTQFTFEKFKEANGVSDINSVDIEDLTRFVAGESIHRLSELSDSISRNGVQVPLIVSDRYLLLDGNRRFFASHLLKMRSKEMGEDIPQVLNEIPVLIIREEDLTEKMKLKILSQANFIPDLKVPWPLFSQAKAIEQYIKVIEKDKNINKQQAIREIHTILGIKSSKATELIRALDLVNEFIDLYSDREDKFLRKDIVEKKFMTFWEFNNKYHSQVYNKELTEKDQKEIKKLFYDYMIMGSDNPIKNNDDIRAVVYSKKYDSYDMLKESKIDKLPLAVSIYKEFKSIEGIENKIQSFGYWLKKQDTISDDAKSYLLDVNKIIETKI